MVSGSPSLKLVIERFRKGITAFAGGGTREQKAGAVKGKIGKKPRFCRFIHQLIVVRCGNLV
jgi:hypothetical protein